VFVVVFDPVQLGLVQSLSHPGGNITGLATYAPGDWLAKRIEILRELVPGASKIALLVNPDNPVQSLTLAEEVPRAVRNLGVALPIVEATKTEELDTAFASAGSRPARRCNDCFWRCFDCSRRPTSCRARGRASSARDAFLPTIRQWRIGHLRPRYSRSIPPCRWLRRQDSQKAPSLSICR
jgi:hypothetical protein